MGLIQRQKTLFKRIMVFIPLALAVAGMNIQSGMWSVPSLTSIQHAYAQAEVLAEDEMSLTDRYRIPSVNDVFADNILLTLSYLSNRVPNAKRINWDEVRTPQQHKIVLKPGEIFAFHDSVMAQYADRVVVTTNAHFNAADGFKSSGLLYGDGVCHLASLFNRAAKYAGLHVVAPVSHNFATIPDISREYGTSIYYAPNQPYVSEKQNLYIENTLDKTITFEITSDSKKVAVQVLVKK